MFWLYVALIVIASIVVIAADAALTRKYEQPNQTRERIRND